MTAPSPEGLNMTDELKPCPFCGSAAKSDNGFSPCESVTYAWCGNNDCSLCTIEFGFTVEEWQARAPALSTELNVPCYQCKGCGDSEYGPWRCNRCDGSGKEPATPPQSHLTSSAAESNDRQIDAAGQAGGPFECTHYDAFTEAHKQVAVEVNALRQTLGMKSHPQPTQPAEGGKAVAK